MASDFRTGGDANMVGKIELFQHLKTGVLCIREVSKEEAGTVVDLFVRI